MSFAARKLFQMGIKVIKDSPDFGNPITIENTSFFLEISKHILYLGKDLLF